MYPDASILMRLMAEYRPMICPFHQVIRCVPAGSSVLDIGCGNGLLLGLLARDGRLTRGIGFDSSSAAIDTAQRMLLRTQPNQSAPDLKFERLDVGKPWPDGVFDVVLLVDVLHHIRPTEQEQVVRLAARQVASGGRLIYKDMSRRPRWKAVMNRIHDLLLARQWIHYAAVDKVERWVKSEAFDLVESLDLGMLWYQHELRVFLRRA